MAIDKNKPPENDDLQSFLSKVNIVLPNGFIEFYKGANGGNITSENAYTILWPLTDLIKLNNNYNVDKYAPDFFIFGSDGGDTAFAIEKSTGHIFELPFIGMSKEEAIFINKNFDQFIELR